MTDRFSIDEVLLDSPYCQGEAVVANDTVDLTQTTRALYIGVTGNVGVQFAGYPDTEMPGNGVILENVPVGVLNIRVNRVFAANTGASSIVALY